MKLTEESADYMDCRPDFDKEPVDLTRVPEHMRATVAVIARQKSKKLEAKDEP